MDQEEFGAGLDDAAAAAAAQSNGHDTQDANGHDQFVSDFQSMFDIQADGPVTRDSIAEYIERQNAAASEAATLRQRIQEYEQKMMEVATRQPDQQQPQSQAAQVAEAKRRYEAAKVDAHLTPFLQANLVELDQAGYYQPKAEYRMNPQVIQACQAKNNQLQNQSRVVNDLVADPYDFWEEGATHSPTLKALKQQIEEFKKSFEDRLTPIAQQTQESALSSFVSQHLPVLSTQKDGVTQWSQAGDLFNKLVHEQGMDPNKALELVKPIAELSAATQAKTKTQKKPPKLIDKISARMNGGRVRPQEMASHGPLEGKRPWKMSYNDIPSFDDE